MPIFTCQPISARSYSSLDSSGQDAWQFEVGERPADAPLIAAVVVAAAAIPGTIGERVPECDQNNCSDHRSDQSDANSINVIKASDNNHLRHHPKADKPCNNSPMHA